MSDVSGNKNLNDGFLDVLMALKKNTMKNTRVAEIGIIEDSTNLKCSLLNNPSMYIQCTKLSSVTVNKGDVVLILFTDTDFRNNLKRINDNLKPLEVTEVNHSINYGVIIGIIKENTENATE